MGCFTCFDSKTEEKLNPHRDRAAKEEHPSVLANFSRLTAGGDKRKPRRNSSLKKEPSVVKESPNAQIAAQIFTFRELAAATNNFRTKSFLGEGGFRHVYKGWLGSGRVVVVKQLDRNNLQGNGEFFVKVLER